MDTSRADIRPFDPSSSTARRRFFIDRALRLQRRGSGSDLARLRQSPAWNLDDMSILDGVQAMLIGAHAAAAYAPPRYTRDVDYIVSNDDYAEAERRMRAAGWRRGNDLVFSGSQLGLIGGAWSKPDGSDDIDLRSSALPWLREAFAVPPVLNSSGKRVMPRVYLILMKMDAARGHDQGDLSRMLGLMNDAEIAEAATVVGCHLDDAGIAEDIVQLAQIGRWEYETHNLDRDDGRSNDSGSK